MTVHGPDNSLGGWGASGTTHLAGTVSAEVSESSGTLVGHVTNNLGVGLVDTEVVTASGLESQALGVLGPGASSPLHLAASSGNGVATAPFLDIPLGSANRQAAERHTEAVQSLYDLGAIYSAQAGGIPVLVAFAGHPLYPLDFATAAERLGPADAVVVPLLPAVRPAGRAVELGPELVGSRGSPASSASQLANGSLAVQEGGSLDYQFVLPPTPWAQLELNFGSLDGSPTSPGIGLGASVGAQRGLLLPMAALVVSAFDYQTSRWDHLRSRAPSGQLVVAVPSPSRYIGPGGAVEVRLSSPSAGLNVYGEVPTLSGSASRASAVAAGFYARAAGSARAAGLMPGQIMIRAEGLRKVYGNTEALSDLTFEVPEGDVLGFIGANGAGKTTALRILAGLTRPSGGWAEVDGVDVAGGREQLHELVGYMPDFFGVYDSMTAAEYLAFYASCYRLPKHVIGRVVPDLLELVHLGQKRDAQVDTLSRGMKQRLCLARALVHDPKVLLLDEPASGLDPRARAEMRELVQALRELGKTIVLSSHILPELAEMCSSYGIIHEGRMVAHGPAGAILGHLGPPRARARVQGDVEEAERRAGQHRRDIQRAPVRTGHARDRARQRARR